jgi:hypothetical protein
MFGKIMQLPFYFKLHVIFMSLMVLGLIKAVLLAFIKKPRKWVLFHRLSAVASVLIGIAGVVFMAVLKEQGGRGHFTTSHSKTAAAALVFVITNVVLGSLLYKGRRLLHLPHKLIGLIAGSLSILAAVFGYRMIAG